MKHDVIIIVKPAALKERLCINHPVVKSVHDPQGVVVRLEVHVCRPTTGENVR